MSEDKSGKYHPWEPVPDELTKGYIDKAYEATNQKQFQEVLDICADAENREIAHPRLVASKSAALIELKRYDEAQALLEKSLNEFPDNPYLHYDLAIIYRRKKRSENAREEAKRVLELLDDIKSDDIDERLSVNISGSLMMLHRGTDAVRFLEWATARFPDKEPLRYHLALSDARKGRWIKAIKQNKGLQGSRKKSVNIQLLMSIALNIILLLFISMLCIFLGILIGTSLPISCLIGLLIYLFYCAMRFLITSSVLISTHQIDRWSKPI